jgi:Putative enzyme of poly-gamma-glutamate biosynthesis (capsule formation)
MNQVISRTKGILLFSLPVALLLSLWFFNKGQDRTEHFPAIIPESPKEVTLLFAGDAMQHQSQLDNAFRNGKYDYSSYFQYVKQEISSADVAVVNLEVTLGGKPYKGYPMFSAPDEYAVALKEAGFDVFLTANNHCLDRHSKGLERTIDVLDSLQVRYTGTFKNEEERARFYPMMLTKNDIRMAFLNYTYDTNGLEVKAPNVVNYIDTNVIKKDIQRAKELDPDIIIANMHWGDEYKLVQNKEQERLARLLAREGADLIIGSHPHVVQPSKVVRDSTGNISRVIVYSLGNFISGMKTPNTVGGQLIKIKLTKDAYKTRINSCSYSLVYVYKKEKEGKTDFTLVPVSRADKRDSLAIHPLIELPPAAYDPMIKFTDTSRKLFEKYNEGVEEYRF